MSQTLLLTTKAALGFRKMRHGSQWFNVDSAFRGHGMRTNTLSKKRLYKVTVQTGNGDVQMVTPTQAVVEGAKMDMKHKLADAAIVQKPKCIRVLSLVPEVERERAEKRNLQLRNLLKKFKKVKNKHQTKKKKKPVQNKKKVKSQIKRQARRRNKQQQNGGHRRNIFIQVGTFSTTCSQNDC